MNTKSITFACYDYDRVAAIQNGQVRVKKFDIAPIILPASEAFPRAMMAGEFDISEMSAGTYLMQTARRECRYIAIPAFVSRAFRHSAIFIRTDRNIKMPSDLAGKLVGIPSYQFTALMWIRGMLQDEYGLDFHELRYRTAPTNAGEHVRRPELSLPSSIEIEPLSSEQTLSDALRRGDVDAVISPEVPDSALDGSSNIARLFPNFSDVERAYRRKTGFFPIMHLIGIKNEVAERYPDLAADLFTAFVGAKASAMQRIRALAEDSANKLTLPWLAAELASTEEVCGRNYWPYGVAENYAELEAMCRYSYEQHLACRPLQVEELFHPDTLNIADESSA